MSATAESDPGHRLFYFNLNDWTWWVWTVTAFLLLAGIAGLHLAYLLAIAATTAQLGFFLARERKLSAFPVQLRAAYLSLLLVCHAPGMGWLYWWPMLGTFALVIFGYCLLARILSLLPWNSDEPYSVERLARTFLSAPDPKRVRQAFPSMSCAGNLCTIEAQISPRAAVAKMTKSHGGCREIS